MLDLSRVTRCDPALVRLVAGAHDALADRQVWLWLTGLSDCVLDVLAEAELHHVLLVNQMSRCRLPIL